MLIHADSYHPKKNIKHFIGRNVIFSYFHFATVKKTRKSTKKKMFTLICNQDGPLGVPHGVLKWKNKVRIKYKRSTFSHVYTGVQENFSYLCANYLKKS